MFDKQNQFYNPFDKFVLRTPLLPFASIYDSLISEDSLINFLKQEIIKESIYIASPVLYDEAIKLIDGKIKTNKERRKIIFSLTKYLLRMSARCTPFGLFAGFSVGVIGNENKFTLRSHKDYRKSARLDMFYFSHLIIELSKIPSVRNQLRYYPNSSIYNIGTKLRYIKQNDLNNLRTNNITEVSDSDYLKKILNKCRNGATIGEIEILIVSYQIGGEDARSFINELIDSQILISELEPRITGGSVLGQIINTFRLFPIKDKLIDLIEITLHEINRLLSTEIYYEIGLDCEVYTLLNELIDKLTVSYDRGKLLQIDLFKPVVQAEISLEQVNDISEAILVLSKYTVWEPNLNLERFKELFLERYQNEELPLLHVLDTEMGLGYPLDNRLNQSEPLIDDIKLPVSVNELQRKWSPYQSHLFELYLQTLKDNKYEIDIASIELKASEDISNYLPDTISLIINVLEKDKATGKQLINFDSYVGANATRLLGRFCNLSEDIFNLTKDIANKESKLKGDKIIAEIVHLPDLRIGNILQRPVLGQFEIPYLARSTVDLEYQIDVNDLKVSIKGNKILLRSTKFNNEIIPRLSAAHNYSTSSLPAYHFLCDLATQNIIPNFGFSWGSLSDDFKFLPRVSYKNIILHLAKWNLLKKDFKILTDSPESNLKDVLISWRKKYLIPRFIALADNDNELVIDLENLFLANVFINEISKRERIRLVEFPFNKSDLLVKGPEGSFVNELIISFAKNEKTSSNYSVEANLSDTSVLKRNYILGEEWLYYKFYCGTQTADVILITIVKPLVDELERTGIIDNWFYIRYADPNEHLRVRFHIKDRVNIQVVIDKVVSYVSPLLENRLIWKIQVDFYQREIERYGADLIDVAERIFNCDSRASLTILSKLNNTKTDTRWMIGIKSIDKLLSDFDMSIVEKQDFVAAMKKDLFEELNGNNKVKLQLDRKFRKHGNTINKLLNENVTLDSNFIYFNSILNQRSIENRIYVREINARCSKEKVYEYIKSYVHMSVNRFFRDSQKTYEIVIYYFLNKYYESQLAKAKLAKN